MRHHIFEEADRYKVALLMKPTAFNKGELVTNFVEPLKTLGVGAHEVIAFTLSYDNAKAPTSGHMKDYLADLLPVLRDLGVTHLYVSCSHYFKVMSGAKKADPHYGYVLGCKAKGYEDLNLVLGLNHQQLIYNPALQSKLDLSLTTLASHLQGTYVAIGSSIIHSAYYPEGLDAIKKALDGLHQYPSLTCDIEGFSLDFEKAGIGTIAFAWDQHNGVAFACDYCPVEKLPHDFAMVQDASILGVYWKNPAVRALLLEFLTAYQGQLTFHNAPYDVKVLIFNLWMKDLLDREGMLRGLDVLSRHWHDTKVITYLATNSTAGNVLGLKPLAHEFAGNWAVDVVDIRKVPLDKLLQYNLVDTLSTWYVRNKYEPIMIADQQQQLYTGLMMPSQKLIVQMELIGMPLSRTKVQEKKAQLLAIQQRQLDVIVNSPIVKTAELLLQDTAWQEDFEDRKAKAKNPHKIQPKPRSDFDGKKLNPNSGKQLQRLLYEVMGLPVIDLTDSKQPATGAETLEKLVNHAKSDAEKALIKALIAYAGVTKIVGTFIKAFELALDKGTGDIVWLHGSFNLGGTVSGRLSSSDPNLQNIPANAKVVVDGVEIHLGKLVKECFVAPEGWIFAGADFNSLEDYISALTTKDPNKLKVYIDGFDGHALRAVSYFRDEDPRLAAIDIDDPKQVNALKEKGHPLESFRQDSKTPTFALTYQGTKHTLMANLGWSEEKASRVEASYHELYKVSDEYIQGRLQQASKDGYVDVAFGLRVRTPMLSQIVWGASKMPYSAAAEGRTAGNAMGQSYGLLNNRAAVEFFEKVWASKYRFKIFPVALIHDAIYILIADELEVVEWANAELIKSMQWQELPEIKHDIVKIGAALDIFWPSWATATTLPNGADQGTIAKLCNDTRAKVLAKAKT